MLKLWNDLLITHISVIAAVKEWVGSHESNYNKTEQNLKWKGLDRIIWVALEFGNDKKKALKIFQLSLRINYFDELHFSWVVFLRISWKWFVYLFETCYWSWFTVLMHFRQIQNAFILFLMQAFFRLDSQLKINERAFSFVLKFHDIMHELFNSVTLHICFFSYNGFFFFED